MTKDELTAAIDTCDRDWEAQVARIGTDGLEKPGVVGRWRVRDVLAHINGWHRWQNVQLRSAFTGNAPSEAELTGGLAMGEPDRALSFEDGMNAMFEAANRDRPLQDLLADWREIRSMRRAWVASAAEEQLSELVGTDWSGEPGRYIRLVAEAPGALDPKPASAFVFDQVLHERAHLIQVDNGLR
jgi:hypothetical protein